MSDINFVELKKQVTIEHVATKLLGLKLTAGKQKVKNKETGEETEVDVLRGCCPVKKSDGARDFVITPGKQAWYSFKAKKGGDVLSLVSTVKEITVRQAAELISGEIGVRPEKAKEPAAEKKFDAARYIETLKPDHEALACFGLTPETLKAWSGGYSSHGQNKGRLALPIVGSEGIAGFVGIGEDRSMVFPENLDPHLYIFGVQMIGQGNGPIYIVRHPLDVLDLYQNAGELGIAFLTETISPEQIRHLAVITREQHVGFSV